MTESDRLGLDCPRCSPEATWKPDNPLAGGPADPICTCSSFCGMDWCEPGEEGS